MTVLAETPSAPAVAAPRAAGGGGRTARALLYAFVLLIPIETVDFLGGGGDGRVVTLSRIAGGLLLGAALADWRRGVRRVPAAFWLIAWYVAAYSLSQLRVPPRLDSLFLAKQVILVYSLGLFLVAANLFRDSAFRSAILRFYGWWTALVAAGMLAGVFGTVYLGEAGRDTILGQDPNVAAGFFAAAAVCLAGDPGLTRRALSLRGALSLAAVAGLVLAIIHTGSRGGLAVFVAGAAGLALCGSRATRGTRALMAAGALAVLGALMVREFQNRTIVAGRLINTWESGDTAGRGQIYGAAWKLVQERPLLGYGGANNFSRLGEELNHPEGRVFYRDTHNLPLAVLTEVGIVGAAPLAAAVLLLLLQAWRHGRRTGDARPFALMCAVLALNASLTGSNQNLFWVVLAAAAACGMETETAVRAS